MAAGVNVAFGHDCVMDPWYGMGSGDMLEVAHMGLHVAQMTSQAGIRACFDAVTVNAAQVMHLPGYGIAAGCDASFVLLQARDVVEAIRLRATRLKVWRRGELLAETPEVVATVQPRGRATRVGFASPRG
jgi:cytosine deaminase